MYNFTPFPTLTTPHLVLRRLTAADEQDMFGLRSNSEVNYYIERTPPASVEDAAKFIQLINSNIDTNKSLFWVLTTPAAPGTVMGTICLWNLEPERNKGELGYELLPQYQRKGYMQEAMTAVLDYGRHVMQLTRVEAFTHKENQPSLLLLQKNNFRRDTMAEEMLEDKAELEYNTIWTLLF